MSYNFHLKGDRIIPGDDFRIPISNQSSLLIDQVPPLNIAKKRSNRIASMPSTYENRYSKVPKPTSLDQNKIATLQHEEMKKSLKTNHDRRFFSNLAKRVSSLGDNFNIGASNSKRCIAHDLQVPDITINDIKDDFCIPLVAKFCQTPARRSWSPMAMAKRVSTSPPSLISAGSSSSSYYYQDSSIDENLYQDGETKQKEEEEDKEKLERDFIEINQDLFVSMNTSQISNDNNSSSSILSSVLNTYGGLDYYDEDEQKKTILEPCVLKPNYVSHTNNTSIPSNTITISQNSDSLFSNLASTPSSEASYFDISSHVELVSTLPTAVYNIKIDSVPSDDFKTEYSSSCHQDSLANVSLSPSLPKQTTCVSPSLDSVYYSCHSCHSRSSSQHFATSKSAIDETYNNKILIASEQLNHNLHRQSTVLPKTRKTESNGKSMKTSREVKRMTSEQYCNSVQISPFLLNGVSIEPSGVHKA